MGARRGCHLLAAPIYLFLAFVIVAFENSTRYLEATGITVVAVLVLVFCWPARLRHVAALRALGGRWRDRSGGDLENHLFLGS